MLERKLSTLGYLMDCLGLPTATLARQLHVDASLVSKWRSGSRRLHVGSAYFDEICTILLAQDSAALSAALRALSPMGEAVEQEQIPILLRHVLTDRHFSVPKAFTGRIEALCTAEIALYTRGEGRRQAINDLLDMAEAMETPGELLYVDSEQSGWLLEDETYARVWVSRLLGLLDRGFHIRVALHFSVTVEKFVSFFRLCNPLIFHRNAQWYYHQYYDENIYWFSFFILEHAMSVMGMSMGPEHSSTTVFTDAYSLLQHKSVVEMVFSSCRPMFTAYAPGQGLEAARIVSGRGQDGDRLFSYLPVPAFISANEDLFDDILRENGITGPTAVRCRQSNQILREMVERQMKAHGGGLVQILQLEEMRRRIREGFVSTSLSLLSGRTVTITPRQYAWGLRDLAARVERYDSYRLFLATPDDDIRLPDMNCWCRGTAWMIQMDSEGFRLCQEPTLSGAASVILEQGWRRVPPGRKDPAAVYATLHCLIEELEACSSVPLG